MSEREPIDFQQYKKSKEIAPIGPDVVPVEPDAGAEKWAADMSAIRQEKRLITTVPGKKAIESAQQEWQDERDRLTKLVGPDDDNFEAQTAHAAQRLIESVPEELRVPPRTDSEPHSPEDAGRFGRGKVEVPMPPNPHKIPGYSSRQDWSGFTPQD